MTVVVMTNSKLSFSMCALALTVAAVLGACNLETPATPSYEKDVRPILLSHCVRCHGAGGTLQGDPSDYPLGDDQRPEGYVAGAPSLCHLNSYADQGDCGADGGAVPPSCKVGAHSCALPIAAGAGSYFDLYVFGPKPLMPPPPAPALTDWEMDILRRWAKNPIP